MRDILLLLICLLPATIISYILCLIGIDMIIVAIVFYFLADLGTDVYKDIIGEEQ